MIYIFILIYLFQNICEDKPPSVNPADKIVPFNQQDEDISDNDKPSSDVSPGIDDISDNDKPSSDVSPGYIYRIVSLPLVKSFYLQKYIFYEL